MFASRVRLSCVALLAFGIALGSPPAASGQTFSNNGLILIPASGFGPGPATPYPSEIVAAHLPSLRR